MDQMLEGGIDNSTQDDIDEQQQEINDDEIDDAENVTIDSTEDNSQHTSDHHQHSVVNQVQVGHQQTIFDPTGQLQYQFKAENGQVTYRVVHVDNNDHHHHQTHHHVVSTPTIVSPAQSAVAQAIIAHAGNPFGGTTAAASAGESGPFYVMMAPQEIIHGSSGQRSRSKQSNVAPVEVPRVARDEKRRATHNEVERRRRDKINNWIIKLSKVVPDCAQDHTKQGQSKGGILAKATEYIQELCMENARLAETMKENEILNNELDAIRQQFVDEKNENRRLRNILARHGIPYENV